MITAAIGSFFIYAAYLDFSYPILNTVAGLFFFYRLMKESESTWFWTGAFIGVFWFWWIGLSFEHYHMHWAIPLVEFGTALIYGGIFWLIAKIALSAERLAFKNRIVASQRIPTLLSLTLKAAGLLVLSYIHPFGFDWFKPELLFVESYIGIDKWRFALVLGTLCLFLLYRRPFILTLLLFAVNTCLPSVSYESPHDTAIVTTRTDVEKKWDKRRHKMQFDALFKRIDLATEQNKKIVILPESVFPVFINLTPELFNRLKEKSKRINIVTGGLYWDGATPKNAAYIFTKEGRVTVAEKTVLVPFGEANPLPDFLSDWVNRIFYDDAVDYKAADTPTDYRIEDRVYRNAICFEATSETLYKPVPKRMIVLSNNGWFVPSTEPTLQRLLLEYYHRKYGTTIYHAINMSRSYTIGK